MMDKEAEGLRMIQNSRLGEDWNVHVVPEAGREHDLTGAPCWCHPKVEDYTAQGGRKLVIHNLEN